MKDFRKILLCFLAIVALFETDAKTIPSKDISACDVIVAVNNNDLEFIKDVVDKGGDLNSYHNNKFGYPIRHAKTPEMIDLMVENGVKLNDIGPKKISVLSMPLTSVEIAKYFVSKGAKVTPNYEQREPILHRMVKGSWWALPDLELIEYLIEQGADLNQKDDFGETPYGRLLHLKRRAHRYIERYSHKNPKALKQHEIINLSYAKTFKADSFPGLEKLLKPNRYK